MQYFTSALEARPVRLTKDAVASHQDHFLKDFNSMVEKNSQDHFKLIQKFYDAANQLKLSKSFYSNHMFCNHLVFFCSFFMVELIQIFYFLCAYSYHTQPFLFELFVCFEKIWHFFVLGMLEQIHFICMMNMPYLHKQE